MSDSIGARVKAQILRLFENYVAANLVPVEIYEMVRRGEYYIVVPEEVTVQTRVTGPYSFSFFRCVRCGRIYDVESRKFADLARRCPACGAPTTQVPVHFPYRRRATYPHFAEPVQEERSAVFSALTFLDPNSHCRLFKVRLGKVERPVPKTIVRTDRARPIASLRWGCPFFDVNERGELVWNFHYLDGSPIKERNVVYVPPRDREYRGARTGELPLNMRPRDCPFLSVYPTSDGPRPLCYLDASYFRINYAHEPVRPRLANYVGRHSTLPRTVDEYSFKLDLPAEPAFRNLRGSFHVVGGEGRPVEFDDLSPLVSRVTFADDVEVYEFTFGAHFGAPDAARRRRVLYVRRDSRGRIEFWGRRMKTQGLLLEFDGRYLSAIASKLEHRYGGSRERAAEVVVHSIGHLLWRAAIATTGLGHDEFGESIIVNEEGNYEYLLYDDSPGGLDGVASLLERRDDRLFVKADYLANLSSILPCTAFCDSSCKECLQTPSCVQANYNLNWRVVDAILPF